MRHEHFKAVLERQFEEGVLPEAEAQPLRAHLRECVECRLHYSRLVDLEDLLDPTGAARTQRMLGRGTPVAAPIEDIDEAHGTDAVHSPASLRPPTRKRWAPKLAIFALAAACVVGFLVMQRQPNTTQPGSEFVARGGNGKVSAGIKIFKRARPRNAVVSPARRSVRQGEALLFAYTNPKGSRLRNLAIVGRDAEGRIHWYHPHYGSASARPKSLKIEAGVADRELPRAIFADHAVGALRVCPLFTKRALDVAALDRKLEAGTWPPPNAKGCKTLTVRR